MTIRGLIALMCVLAFFLPSGADARQTQNRTAVLVVGKADDPDVRNALVIDEIRVDGRPIPINRELVINQAALSNGLIPLPSGRLCSC